MKRIFSILIICLSANCAIFAQPKTIQYYLPDISYDKAIPTPESYLGHSIGEWHITHDQLVGYMKTLAASTPRIVLQEFGRTHENRPLIYMLITSEKNHKAIADIKAQHVALSNGAANSSPDFAKMPAVLYQGFSIHGNEPSGVNAAPLVAYYLAAGKSREVEKLLEDVVIILDPCFNPDGVNRFASWANTHKNENLTPDPADREYNEAWPGGRSNHYWFDLNRDWLVAQHPESKARAQLFHEWKPNVLTDHHEMGTNSTFFFMPGHPKRVYTQTPKLNQELTAKIGTFHADALDELGSLYFSGEGYDDFYIGKGSTFPDVNGCIGILFEQASSRGHLQESDNGLLSFPFTIRNQVTTALSTLKAVQDMRVELLTYQRDFYRTGLQKAQESPVKGYVFQSPEDPGRLRFFLEMLQRHQINVYKLGKDLSVDGQRFPEKDAFIVPVEQNQYHLIRGIFDTQTTFEDSLFYDISTWTMPLAFNLTYKVLDKKSFEESLVGKVLSEIPSFPSNAPDISKYSYLIDWQHYNAPAILYALQKAGVRVKVAQEPFTAGEPGKKFAAGTLLVPVQNQPLDAEALFALLDKLHDETGVSIFDIDSGFTPEGADLGSSRFSTLTKPSVLLVIGEGVTSTEAGQVWHLLDKRYGMDITKCDAARLARTDLKRYTTIIMVSGTYPTLSSESLRTWVQSGGNLIAIKEAVSWLKDKGIVNVTFKTDTQEKKSSPAERKPYGQQQAIEGANEVAGAIFEATIDLTHPLAFGYTTATIPVFRNHERYLSPGNNPYSTPLVYTVNPLLSGYLNEKNKRMASGTAGLIACGQGSGRVICFGDDPVFRAFWFGTDKLLANALFFGKIIQSSSLER